MSQGYINLDENPYAMYEFYYDEFAIYQETSTEVGYDEAGVELPF